MVMISSLDPQDNDDLGRAALAFNQPPIPRLALPTPARMPDPTGWPTGDLSIAATMLDSVTPLQVGVRCGAVVQGFLKSGRKKIVNAVWPDKKQAHNPQVAAR